MRRYFLLFFVIAAILVASCRHGCIFPREHTNTPFSFVTYLQNTLDYSISVQAYYIPFDDDTAWTTHDEKACGDPIEIQPGEAKVIMDYVLPSRIEIRDGQTGSLLHEYRQQPLFTEMYPTHDDALNRIDKPNEVYGFLSYDEIGPIESIGEYEKGSFGDAYFVKDNRYLSQNIDWEEYPIWFQYKEATDYLLHASNDVLKERVELYEMYFNGYTVVQFLTTNTAAECFVQR